MKKILVVDDNDSNLYLIRFILEKGGYEVIEARDGLEVVKLALEKKPDLIIMDIQLPGIDGLEATRRIRASEVDGKVPIIALTALVMTVDREETLAAGCNGYISKPINPKTFLPEMKRYLVDAPHLAISDG